VGTNPEPEPTPSVEGKPSPKPRRPSAYRGGNVDQSPAQM
jgi:hypothetical protein